MAQIDFFNKLKGKLRNAKSQAPMMSTAALGFTDSQIWTMQLKKPRLIWFHAPTQTFYDQGDSTKIKKSEWTKINDSNFKKDKPMKDLKYYIPIDGEIVKESNKHLYK